MYVVYVFLITCNKNTYTCEYLRKNYEIIWTLRVEMFKNENERDAHKTTR